MIYIRNTNTNEIENLSSIPSNYYGTEKETFTNENGITCQRSKLKDEYIELTENDLEVQEKILLPEIKEKQIALIKQERDAAMSEPHNSTKARILRETAPDSYFLDFVYNNEGEQVEECFEFNLETASTPLNQPDVILNRVLNDADADFYLKYSCKFADNSKGYVALDKKAATSIMSHLTIRGSHNVFLANKAEDLINSISISKDKSFEVAKKEIESTTLKSIANP